MSRYLILLLLIAAIWWMLRGERRASIKRHQAQAAPAPAKPSLEGERMVACAQCDLHLPISDAVPGGSADESGRGRIWFCSEPHRQLFERVTTRHDAGPTS